MDARASGRMGSMAMAYYMTTTLLATTLGIACVLIIHPGDPELLIGHNNGHSTDDKASKVSSLDAFLDLLRCIPIFIMEIDRVNSCMPLHGIITKLGSPCFRTTRSYMHSL